MAAPATPNNLVVQSGNGEVYLSWNVAPGALSYEVFRSLDGLVYTSIATPTVAEYTDNTVVVQTKYYYKVRAVNLDGSSPFTQGQVAIPTLVGTISLYALRLLAQQMADRVGSNFVSTSEWNTYINQSATELYDILVTDYEDYFLTGPYMFTTNGTDNSYPLPDGSIAFTIDGVKAPGFYKLMGVDLSLDTSNKARVTIHKFDFIERNRYVYPNITSSALGVFNLRYRVMGNRLHLMPTPSAGQVVQLWYIPRLDWAMKDTDVFGSISGWAELIAVDAAIKALLKEESDTSAQQARKDALMERVRVAAMNRDAGQPDTISPTRRYGSGYGGWSDGSSGGF